MKPTDENESLISKKSLLEKYSISYGALYRWKRKGLIPEDWFIKKSNIYRSRDILPGKADMRANGADIKSEKRYSPRQACKKALR